MYKKTLLSLCLASALISPNQMHTAFAETTSSTAESTNSNEKIFSIPANSFCDSTHSADLSLNLTNVGSEASKVKLVLYKKDGTVFEQAGTSSNGIESDITPGTEFTLNANESTTYHVTFNGFLNNCDDRAYWGKIVSSTSSDLVASGQVITDKGIADISINGGTSWSTEATAPVEEPKPEENLLPALTGDNTENGIATASTTFSSAFAAYKAFDDQLVDSSWVTAQNVKTGWLAYEFTSEKTVTKYAITPRVYIASGTDVGKKESPKDWTFEGWNGSEWVVLDTQTNITDWTPGTATEFSINNTTKYKKYRINITANNGYTWLGISEFDMFGQ
jgi:hypothetical protein